MLNEVVDAQTDATRVELDAIPDPKRKRYKATYEGLDPEDPEDKKVIEQRHRFEIWMNELRDLDKEEGLPMRTKSLQEWMFNR